MGECKESCFVEKLILETNWSWYKSFLAMTRWWVTKERLYPEVKNKELPLHELCVIRVPHSFRLGYGEQKGKILLVQTFVDDCNVVRNTCWWYWLEETLFKVSQQALDNVRVGRTTLIMVHRQLTFRHPDYLVVFRIRSSCGTTKSQTTFSHEKDLLCFK